MSTVVEIARQQWAEGRRRLETERSNPARYRLLLAQTEAVTDELRRRLGGIFTLAELADAYRDADPWIRDVVAELAPGSEWAPGLTTAADAAFHRYARGARDYEP